MKTYLCNRGLREWQPLQEKSCCRRDGPYESRRLSFLTHAMTIGLLRKKLPKYGHCLLSSYEKGITMHTRIVAPWLYVKLGRQSLMRTFAGFSTDYHLVVQATAEGEL